MAPIIGIQRDDNGATDFGNPDGPHSYSAVIQFDDETLPCDATRISDSQFGSLCALAYGEMVNIWRESGLKEHCCPEAMAVVESDGLLFFASSIKSIPGKSCNSIVAHIQGSVGNFQATIEERERQIHRSYGSCAEVNVLRLYREYSQGQRAEISKEGGEKEYKGPHSSTSSPPRLAAWITKKKGKPSSNEGISAAPCKDPTNNTRPNEVKYGCSRVITYYGLKPVVVEECDRTRENDWKFARVSNPWKPYN